MTTIASAAKKRRGNILRHILEIRKHWLMMVMMADHVSAVCLSGYYQLRRSVADV